MAKSTYMTLQQTEGFVVQAAASIYAAYISAQLVSEGEEATWRAKSISEAIAIAKATDDAIVAEGELA